MLKPVNIVLFAVFSTFFLFTKSCEAILADKNTYLLSEEIQEWLLKGNVGDVFILKDTLDKPKIVSMDADMVFMSGSQYSSGFLNTEEWIINDNETRKQEFTSADSFLYSITAKAGEFSGLDFLDIEILDLEVKMNPLEKRINEITFWKNTSYSSRSGSNLDRYETRSSLSFPDSMTINDKVYTNVFEFKFMDFEERWTDFTVTYFAYAKGIGLLSYSLNNGEKYKR